MRARVAIDVLGYEYNHDERTKLPRLSAASLQLAVAVSDQETKKSSAPSARLTWLRIILNNYYTAVAGEGHCAGLGCLVEKKPREAPRPLPGSQSAQAWMFESMAERSALGASLDLSRRQR